MYIAPPKLIEFMPSSISVLSTWAETVSGDPYRNSPYQWTMTITITPQKHGDKFTQTPYTYNGLDLTEGMWLSNKTGGYIYKIINIHPGATATQVTIDIEDVDRMNLSIDPSRLGSNVAPQKNSYGYIFDIDQTTGLPILMGIVAGVLSAQYQTDLMSRFLYRNYMKSNVRVLQDNHNLNIGDVIFMDTDGLYKEITADKDNKDNLGKIVGTVTDISIPGVEYFTYRPRGDYQTSINPPLPGTVPGSVIYLDTVNPGQLTSVAPKVYATPVYIQLGSSTEGIYLMGGSGSGGSSGPLGYSATVYTVATIADRDALDTTLLNPGDQVYVSSNENGIWALYIASAIDTTQTPPVVTWTQISDDFSNDVDSGTTSTNITYQTPNSTNLVSIKQGVRIINIVINVTEVFSSDAQLTIGDDSINDRLVDNNDLDLTIIGNYSIFPNYEYSQLTEIKSYLTIGASTTGKATITVSYL